MQRLANGLGQKSPTTKDQAPRTTISPEEGTTRSWSTMTFTIRGEADAAFYADLKDGVSISFPRLPRPR